MRFAKVSSTIVGDVFAIQTAATNGKELATDLANAGENAISIDWDDMDVAVNGIKISPDTALPTGVLTVEVNDAENDGGIA